MPASIKVYLAMGGVQKPQWVCQTYVRCAPSSLQSGTLLCGGDICGCCAAKTGQSAQPPTYMCRMLEADMPCGC